MRGTSVSHLKRKGAKLVVVATFNIHLGLQYVLRYIVLSQYFPGDGSVKMNVPELFAGRFFSSWEISASLINRRTFIASLIMRLCLF